MVCLFMKKQLGNLHLGTFAETVHTDECVAAKKFIECCFAKKTELAVTSKLW